MSGLGKRTQPAMPPAVGVEDEVARIGGMNVADLSRFWRETFGVEPPSAFSKDLLARAIAYRLQEQAFGGLKPQTARLLRTMAATPGAEPPRQVKVGSVIVREHRGVLHEVMVVPGGFCWQGQIFDSLSTIAKKITGVSWNGPRFFGLRSKAGVVNAGPVAEADDTTGRVPDGRIEARAEDQPSQGTKGGGSVGGKGADRSIWSGRRSSIRIGARP